MDCESTECESTVKVLKYLCRKIILASHQLRISLQRLASIDQVFDIHDMSYMKLKFKARVLNYSIFSYCRLSW